MADTTLIPTVHTGLVHRIQTAMQDLATRYAQYRLYRQTLRELRAMSARDLADLGLNRSEIRRVAYHAAYE